MPALRVLEHVRWYDSVWKLPAAQVAWLRERFPDVHFDSPPDRESVTALLPAADIVLGWGIRRDNFEFAKQLRWVHVTAAGVEPLMFPAFIESDVVLTNARGMHSRSMAEHAIGVMLAFARKLHFARDAQHRRSWDQEALSFEAPPIAELEGGTLGLVGFGSIGQQVATRARGLGMRVIAVRRNPDEVAAPADAQWGMDRLDALLAESDFVVVCAALTHETRGLLDATRLARMRTHAVLINVARGAIIDEPALIAALQSGAIAGAGLDVMAEEPLPGESPLWTMPNVILTPHISGMGPRYWERSVEMFAGNLARYIAGESLLNVVDKRAGY
ncbi:MAG: D-2-hydroxyacid dehydrogenase [Candidatus Eisenbacteria bacterium]|uniref:D-2-hydroxyacid dehydrogenase n=1 Tax=Eiseniibacteriota bacterium TaxID=2212470 RepID=A0A849T0Q9_UNCEI|nr:D-2-hydroxyacid dehydrogenase [Candidatus Eisenbacteria bacterium]